MAVRYGQAFVIASAVNVARAACLRRWPALPRRSFPSTVPAGIHGSSCRRERRRTRKTRPDLAGVRRQWCAPGGAPRVAMHPKAVLSYWLVSLIGRTPERTFGFISLIHLDADGGNLVTGSTAQHSLRWCRDASQAVKLDHFSRTDEL